MLLEELREKVRPYCYVIEMNGVVNFVTTLESALYSLVPEKMSDYCLSRRQEVVFENASNLLLKCLLEENEDYLWQAVSETYDIVQNYNDTNHPVSFNEYVLLNHLLKLFRRILQ